MLTTQRRHQKALRWRGVIVALLFSLAACAGAGTYGKLVNDDEVDQLFKNLTVLPDHNYYYSGSDARPRAIIAIDETYTLSSRLWKPVDITTEQLKHWVLNPSRQAQFDSSTYGRFIMDDKGQRIGFWYSIVDWRDIATVKMLDATTVQVSTPVESPDKRRVPMFFGDDDY